MPHSIEFLRQLFKRSPSELSEPAAQAAYLSDLVKGYFILLESPELLAATMQPLIITENDEDFVRINKSFQKISQTKNVPAGIPGAQHVIAWLMLFIVIALNMRAILLEQEDTPEGIVRYACTWLAVNHFLNYIRDFSINRTISANNAPTSVSSHSNRDSLDLINHNAVDLRNFVSILKQLAHDTSEAGVIAKAFLLLLGTRYFPEVSCVELSTHEKQALLERIELFVLQSKSNTSEITIKTDASPLAITLLGNVYHYFIRGVNETIQLIALKKNASACYKQAATMVISQQAEKGFAPAKFFLVRFNLDNGVTINPSLNLILEASAKQDFTPAQALLGNIHDGLHGGTKNPTDATRWYLKAAEQSHPHAQYKAGCLSEEKLKVKLWFLAALQGVNTAQYELGKYYAVGHPPKNLEKAIYWLETAAANKHIFAKSELERLQKQYPPSNQGSPATPEKREHATPKLSSFRPGFLSHNTPNSGTVAPSPVSSSNINSL